VSATPSGTSIISRGPYRIVRHPMYLSMLLFIWAAVASHASVLTLTIGVAVTVMVVVRVIVEERLLRAHYPGYHDYTRSTHAMVPYLF
jgi:protein-S-isoprenylcysteine O-methyltransferase Ste14